MKASLLKRKGVSSTLFWLYVTLLNYYFPDLMSNPIPVMLHNAFRELPLVYILLDFTCLLIVQRGVSLVILGKIFWLGFYCFKYSVLVQEPSLQSYSRL